MKKRVSFLVAVILIACTFFGSVVPVHAAEKQTDHIIAEGEPIDYDYAEANGYVGILTIFSCDSGQDSSLTYWGHSWVTFTNIDANWCIKCSFGTGNYNRNKERRFGTCWNLVQRGSLQIPQPGSIPE